MEFEWDPAKSEAIIRRRGIGFERAAEIFTGRTLEWPDERRNYGELRLRAVGESAGELLHIVYVVGAGKPFALFRRVAPIGRSGHSGYRAHDDGRDKGTRCSRTPEEEAEFRRRMDATTDEDIRRHMIEDAEDPDEEPHFELVVLPQDVRKKLGMTQADFAALLRVPIGTLRNWEQNRFVMEPAAQTLLKLIYREPEAALRALREPHAA